MATIDSDILYYFNPFLIWFITALLLHFFIKRFLRNPSRTQVPPPPTPPALPFIGHLHLVGAVIPKSFQALAKRHGPLMEIRLGASSCVVASNATVAKEIFKTQELNFSSRPEFGSSEHFIYRGSRFVLAQYGDYWRFMKKLCMTRLLAVPQLDKFIDIRDEEKVKLVESVMKHCREGSLCDLTTELTSLTNNTICRMAMSTRCSENDDDAAEIKTLIRTCLQLSGKIHVGDVLGPLKFLDFSGNGKKLKSALLKFDRLMDRVIKEHEEEARKGSFEDKNRRKDVLDILLEVYRDPNAEVKITMKDIKSFLLDIFMAGTDTTSSSMQWAMGQLINNPKAFKKLRDEINSIVGSNRLVKESDIPNLPYLQAVIKETLRLHPPAPLIIRECAKDCKVNGYLVKAKTRVLVNIYASMRDPDSWRNPEQFSPERFLKDSEERIGDHQMEYKGLNFRYLPFGSGRRGCPGASLAMLSMHAAVGCLVQCFDWKLKDGEIRVDLSPGSGFASEMARPLVCYPVVHFNPFGAIPKSEKMI